MIPKNCLLRFLLLSLTGISQLPFNLMAIRSYVRSTDSNRKPCGEYVMRGIDVSVVSGFALRALPLPDIQRHLVDYMPTRATSFTAGEPTVNFYQGSTIPLGFVFQLSNKLAPTSITDSTGKFWIFDHVFNCQILNYYRLGFTYQSSCQLVQMVFSRVRNLGLNAGNFKSCFVSVARGFSFATQSFLRFPQLLVVLVKGFGISNLLACTQGNKAANSYIQTYSAVNWFQLIVSWVINPQTNKPASRLFKLNCNSCRLT